jgi:hypothetical protein
VKFAQVSIGSFSPFPTTNSPTQKYSMPGPMALTSTSSTGADTQTLIEGEINSILAAPLVFFHQSR